ARRWRRDRDGRVARHARDNSKVRRPDRRIPRSDRLDPTRRRRADTRPARSTYRAHRRRDPALSDPARRRLPPVHAVLGWPGLAAILASRGREATLRAVRATLEKAREAL